MGTELVPHTRGVSDARRLERHIIWDGSTTLRENTMNRIGIIGSGSIGAAVARLAVRAGYEVLIANSRGPETLAGLIEELGPRA
ncbi:NAD(P)-binding domain-containing protein [Arthrobacter sp. 754]|uniref:NAD(P)-binding domain-containing protein n=1 Tax=Arthrobacter sp. 754 TaxID=3156315 RepID=UPI0033994EB3